MYLFHTKTHQLWNHRSVRIGVYAGSTLLYTMLVFHAGAMFGARAILVEGPRRFHGIPPPPLPFGVSMPHGFMPQGHGLVGVVQSVTPPYFTITTREGDETRVVLATSSTIRSGNSTLRASELRVGDAVILVGEPEHIEGEGYLEAHLVRVIATATTTKK